MSSDPLIMKLEHAGGLEDKDKAALHDLVTLGHSIEANRDLCHEGDRPETVHLVLEGLAYRYKLVSSGKRQILGLLLPGDFCDIHVAILAKRDHSIGTISPCRIAEIPRRRILDLTARHLNLARAFWWATLVDESILRTWLVNVGQREGQERIAHLFCEILVRLQSLGHATTNSYALPLTQAHLADMLSFSSVHVNRGLQGLRGSGMIILKGGKLQIPDVQRLKDFCSFNSDYLHLNPRVL